MTLHIFWKEGQFMCHFSSTPSKELLDVVQGLLNSAQHGGIELVKRFAKTSGWNYFG
jgi:hypothetical protein